MTGCSKTYQETYKYFPVAMDQINYKSGKSSLRTMNDYNLRPKPNPDLISQMETVKSQHFRKR